MATNCLQLPMASCSIPSSSSYSSTTNRRVFRTYCSSRKLEYPPLNPKDPFLKNFASIAANNPDMFTKPRNPNFDLPPFLDMYPTLMASPAQLERSSSSYSEHRPRRPPPDLPSLLLHGRIVYIGMPLVPAVTELVVAQLMYLQYMDPKAPIYIYINSTGTTRDDGEVVAMDTEGFAIYDAMMQTKTEIHTVVLGCAIGQACLILAAGTKGKRYMMPNATAQIQQPRMPSYGIMQASDVAIRAREVLIARDTLVELLAKHTENSEETIFNAMKRPFYMDAVKAKRFGVIDKILWRGQEALMAEVAPPEYWDKTAGVKADDTI